MTATLYTGDALDVLRTLPDESVQCCVTSPPYWGLRDYGVPGQMGLEKTPEEYVAKIVEVFREVRRVLRDDGTLWLNLGDSYASSWPCNRRSTIGAGSLPNGKRDARPPRMGNGLKDKDLVGVPWRVAFALRADGWYLRSDIIWSKPNPMPESVTDRPTKAHEYVFLFSKSQRYFYDAAAISRPATKSTVERMTQDVESQKGSLRAHGGGVKVMKAVIRKTDRQRGHSRRHAGFNDRWDSMSKDEQQEMGANARTVWEIATKPYSGAHFATMPPELASRCIKAGSKPRDTILDPFGGSGTTASVATGLGRNAIHIDLTYHDLARDRIGPMLCEA